MLVEGDSLLPISISDLGQVLNLYGPQFPQLLIK